MRRASVSKEMDAAESHNIIPDGYDIGKAPLMLDMLGHGLTHF